jgi:hypothetical protein
VRGLGAGFRDRRDSAAEVLRYGEAAADDHAAVREKLENSGEIEAERPYDALRRPRIDGLEIVKKCESCKLVELDEGLPGAPGFEFVRRLR